jgi:uncharacterized repeat protein (TIGR01451 family)
VKRASWALALLIFHAPALCHAHLAAGGREHPTDFGSFAWSLRNESFQNLGRVRLQLIVEGGVFLVASPGRLRAYSHRYRYIVRNLDLAGGDESTIVSFAPFYCGAAPVTELPALSQGGGDPSTWSVRLRTEVPVPYVEWTPNDPSSQGIPPEGEWTFVLYSNAEPELGFLTIGGRFQPSSGEEAEATQASLNYWVPGCGPPTGAGVPDLNWEKSVDTPVSAAGRLLSYTLRATNVGVDAAARVVLVDPLPAALAYVAGTTTLNGAPVPDPSPGQTALANGLTVPLIAPGASATVRFQARVRAGQGGGKTIENTATLTTPQTPPLTSPIARTLLLVPDTVAPVVAVTSPRALTYTKSESQVPLTLPLQFSITDTDPGLDPATVQATLDGAPVQSGRSLDLFDLRPGPHTLRILARDFAGNAADVKVTFTVAATIQSTLWDIFRLQNTGGIRMSRTSALLAQTLEAAQERFWFADSLGMRMSLEFFLSAVTDPRRRLPPQPLLTAEAAAILEADARYLLATLMVFDY